MTVVTALDSELAAESQSGRKRYLTVATRLAFMLVFAALWMGGSLYLAIPWINALANDIGLVAAWLVVAGIALIPGYINAFLIAGLLFDWRPKFKPLEQAPGLSILIAAYNEEDSIYGTLGSIYSQNYPGPLQIVVINDGSQDRTAEIVREFQVLVERLQVHYTLELIDCPKNAGKAAALNQGLMQAKYDLVATVDADSMLFGEALLNIVTNHVRSPSRTASTAGCVLVRNSRKNMLAKLQEWDYFLGISVVKRIQSLLQGTLVAQGAFSVYNKSALEEIDGWRDTVGEDIVLTWKIIEKGYRVGFAENAFAFTNVPEDYRTFYNQRKRWSRGLIEAFKRSPRVLIQLRLNTPFVWLNVLFPYLDCIYLFIFLPGVLGAIFFKYYAVASIVTLLLLPLILILNLLMYVKQVSVFNQYGLKVRRNILGALVFMLGYQAILAPACIVGYASEMFNLRKSW
ncbi:biofilm PGA synthesis N-glycosyltransferase PgaC [Litorivivens lipolytica]|uniref:Biofilm PGA synthesis N-glycosyltransferase PgaC n=1 Tax=Litorivivens lipolytica TaxID=1524264 RepID=A0A7W4W481_9GAMM|nr:glycosyltransferase family 2 protein [Litorivivens lipolytica]MBB3046843.1 biofilm PGA synthesis N-glycosyltransferase PgaC [Litorivivens lipolytica]